MSHLNSNSGPNSVKVELPRHYLYPGTLFVHRKPHLVTTVLGSCISVCLWDPVGRVGGINHYLLPLWNGEGLPTPKYGNIAISKLIENVKNQSENPDKLIAKVFGGASMWEKAEGLLAIGQRNIEYAQEALEQHRIKIVGHDLGGHVGRKIIFNTHDGTVLMRRQKGLRSAAAGE
ncbi:MAG: chemotaxis protein CheD [Desulfuromonadales bacterium]|nr:chemotaxis protein CheD [Desulfuromonadales bacterium]